MQSMQGHLSWTRLLWVSWEDLLLAQAVLTLAMSSCVRLCPARIPHVARGDAREAVNSACQWQKNPTAIFLTEKSMCLVPGSSNANAATFSKAGTWAIPGVPGGPNLSVAAVCLGEGRGMFKLRKNVSSFPLLSHMFSLWQRGLGE